MKIALLTVLALSGCVLDDPTDTGTEEQDIASTNKLATNKLATNKLATNKLATNKLAAASFAIGSTGSSLIETSDGRDVLTYMLGCALTPAQSLTLTTSTGTPYTFTGLIGVAPAWTTRALTLDEQRWVTGCLLARVNYFGVLVNLSMRGNLPALATTSAEATYTQLDGSFYGNLFDPAGPTEYACDGRADNTLRICADVSPDGVTTMCGFKYTGFCRPTLQSLAGAACTGTPLAPSCRTTLTGTSPAPYTQTVQVYLQ
ncbi:MAG TPA: hypothetical protein VF403_25325 [Kofleriaceae bacterium]